MLNESTDFGCNQKAYDFVKKWRRDTKLSIFLIGPLQLLFFIGCFTMIVGISLKLLVILFVPIVFNLIGFFYTPLLGRKKNVNCLINHISLDGDSVSVLTFSWFYFKSYNIKFDLAEISVISIEDTFFKNLKIWSLSSKASDGVEFYLVEEFFDFSHKLLLTLHGKMEQPPATVE